MFILNWVKYYTKEATKTLGIIAFATFIILTVIIAKYKPAYEVKLAGEKVGFVENNETLNNKIENYLNDITGNVAFKEQTLIPEYQLKLINRDKKLQEDEILLAIENSTIITYKTYAVTVDGEVKTTVESEEEAKNIVDIMKADVSEEVGLNVGIIEQYSNELNLQSQEEATGILNTIKIAKIEEYNAVQEAKRIAEAEEAKKKIISAKTVESVGTIAGINLSRPISGGSISSRFGSRSSIRSSNHTGLDIAASMGTQITPIAPGTVTFAGYKGSYGNLVIVNHGNGIETYYAHCSSIYCNVGDSVNSNTVISAVGSTGNSTGPHLHLEIRQNGSPLNPENYLY